LDYATLELALRIEYNSQDRGLKGKCKEASWFFVIKLREWNTCSSNYNKKW